ncbi:MAG: AtpZ/AtpI family protein [Paracoccaceae bacterium]
MPSDHKDDSDLINLSQKLDQVKSRKKISRVERRAFGSANLGWRMIVELVIGMLFGIFLGLGLDYLFETKPLFLIIMALFGFAGGVKAMMRTAKELDK